MWKIYVSISLIGLAGAGFVVAQGTGPYSGDRGLSPPTAQPAQAGIIAPAGGLFESNTFLEMANRVFNPDSDSMDFENGSFEWKGRSFNLVNQRAFRSRFERFLLSSPTEDEQRYAQLIDDILERLSVANNNSDDAVIETWSMLFRASEFEADGGNCSIVANQVFNAWRIRKESRATALTAREQEDLRKYQQDVVANRTRMLQKLREKRQRESSLGRGKQGQNAGSGDDLGVTEAAFRALELAETEARIAALEVQSTLTGTQAKLQFQSQIVNFILQRRFEHALILAGFYQLLFKGSQPALGGRQGRVERLFPGQRSEFHGRYAGICFP